MKKIFIFLPVALALGIVGTGLFFWYKSRTQPPSPYEIFVNEKHGFSFEYPSDWFMEEISPEAVRLTTTNKPSGDGGVPLGAKVEVFALENYNHFGLEKWISWMKSENDLANGQAAPKTEEIKLAGKKAIKEITKGATGLIEQGDPITVYSLIGSGDYILQINYVGREPDYSEALSGFNHILDSFKEI